MFLKLKLDKCFSVLAVSVFTLLFHAANAQVQNVYWIQFNSKSSNLFLPKESFLSPKAIERRQKQNIEIVENDYPVYAPYKQAVAQVADSIIHTLKWFNAITIVLSDTNKMPQIRNMSFVKKIQKLDVYPVAEKKENSKLDFSLKAIEETEVRTEYGESFNQTEMLHLDRLHSMGYRGKDMFIAVLDNGFVNVDTIKGFQQLFSENRVVYKHNYVNRNDSVFGSGTHGTSVLSCIAGNLPNVFVGTATQATFALFITENNQSETILEEYNWAEAAEKADSLGVDITTTSLGYNNFDGGFASHTYFDMTGSKAVMTQAANIAFSKGILVVNSAGNEGTNSWKFITAPADGKDVLTIGAVDKNGKIANFSSRGPNASGAIKPDVCAQGANVAVLDFRGLPFLSNGTSFSGPIIAGAAACLWQSDSTLSAAELKKIIIESSNYYTNPNNNYGYGIPNFYKAWLSTTTKKALVNSEVISTVFPNPFSRYCTLFIKTSQKGEAGISIADISGKVVFKTAIPVFENDVQLLEIKESELLSAGSYYLKIEVNGSKKTHRIIKTDL